MTRRYELKDEEYAVITDLLPAVGRPGGRWNDHRTTLDGISGSSTRAPNGVDCPSVTANGRASTTASTASTGGPAEPAATADPPPGRRQGL
jgi:hypothetical protein